MSVYSVGVDLGQRRDHTAIAVVERREAKRADWTVVVEAMSVRHLERVPLGTPYPLVVERVAQIVKHRELAGNCTLAVDATGVGVPVVEMLRGARLGCELCAVTITSGAREHRDLHGASVPKRDLLSGLQLLMEKGELKIARNLKEAGALMRELVDVQYRHLEGGGVRIGADGSGQHDDLVIALALACWGGRKKGPSGHMGRRLNGI